MYLTKLAVNSHILSPQDENAWLIYSFHSARISQ